MDLDSRCGHLLTFDPWPNQSMWNSEHKFKTHPLATQHSCRENHHLWKVNHLNGPCSQSIAGVSPGWPRHTMAFTNFRRNLSCASRLATPKLRQRSKFRTKRACCSARDPKKRQTNQVGTWRSRDSQTFGFQLQPINPIYPIHSVHSFRWITQCSRRKNAFKGKLP